MLWNPFDVGISPIGCPVDFGADDVTIYWECAWFVQFEISLPKEWPSNLPFSLPIIKMSMGVEEAWVGTSFGSCCYCYSKEGLH